MAAAVDASAPLDREGYLKLANYPLIKQSDMNEEMRVEAVEICASGARRGAGRGGALVNTGCALRSAARERARRV